MFERTVRKYGHSRCIRCSNAADCASAATDSNADERARLLAFERENRELKRANEILRTTRAFLAAAELNRFTR